MKSSDRTFAVAAAYPLALGLFVGMGCQQPATVAGHPDAALFGDQAGRPAPSRSRAETSGRVVDAPSRITDIEPTDISIRVDASRVNLRAVFEDLGPESTLWYQHVQTLANPFFEGRAPETRGLELVADYIAFYFRLYGLDPAFPQDADEAPTSYKQPFAYTKRDRVPTVKVTAAEMKVNGERLHNREDFTVLGNSGDGEVTLPVSFVGYGIAGGPDGYSSFDEDTDLTGRAALLLRYTPLDDDGDFRWSEDEHLRRASLRSKMGSLNRRGASAILLVNPPGAKDGGKGLEPLDRSRRFGPGLDVPVVQLTPETADLILRQADGRGLTDWRRLADRGEVRTVDLDDSVRVTVITAVERKRTRHELHGTNAGGVLRGKGDLADEWVVIGAHHDHVGVGKHGGVRSSRARGKLHPGADDNASGTAGVLVLAKMLSETYAEAADYEDLRSILFLTFDAEEMGLHGSRFFADHATIPPEKTSILLNMDMIGRLRGNYLMVLGTATAEGLPELLKPHFEASGMTVAVTGAGSGMSDDANFHRISVPALHFFTGMHKEYTSPGDQAFTVNPAGAGEILDLLFDIAYDVANRPELLVYQEPPSSPGQDRGYGRVRLGIRPDMGEEPERGVLVDTVGEGTSAHDAGVQSGDIIIAWDGTHLDGLGDLAERLRQHEPGDKIKLTVLREGKRLDLDVTLKSGSR